MLTIYGVLRSRATRNVWLAEELGIAYRHVPVMQRNRLTDDAAVTTLNSRSPEFLKVNPNGRIPVIDDDGFVLCESLAINLYLARKHGGPLAPKDLHEDGLMAMWALWGATEVEPAALDVLYNLIVKPPAERDLTLVAKGIETLRQPFGVLDGVLAGHDHVVGDRFTVCDINLAEIFRYAMPAKELFVANPNVAQWLARCQSRPAFKAMMARREAEPA